MYMKVTFKDNLYCNTTFDGFLCWPPTPAGEAVQQNCPDIKLSDATQLAYRRCGADGLWAGRHPNETSPNGWTNYTPCFPPLVQSLFYKVYDDEGDAQAKFAIASSTRYLEIIGYSTSFIAVMISLYIFTFYRALRNTRISIHRNLFLATVKEIFIRLVVYIDQEIVRRLASPDSTMLGIDNIPYLCEGSYILLEYSQSAVFTWMLIEGIFLNHLVNDAALRTKFSYRNYLIFGWLSPAISTLIWALATAYQYKDETTTCWYGYNFTTNYIIAQGPRWAIIMYNFVLLLKIMNVVVKKLRVHSSSDLEMINKTDIRVWCQLKSRYVRQWTEVLKATRATLVLLPLLGLTNVFSIYQLPVDVSVYHFAAWCYVTHFLRSFQGLFIAVIYCFRNGDVKAALKKHWANYQLTKYLRDRNSEELPRTTFLKSDEIRSLFRNSVLDAVALPFLLVAVGAVAVDQHYKEMLGLFSLSRKPQLFTSRGMGLRLQNVSLLYNELLGTVYAALVTALAHRIRENIPPD